VGPRRAGRRTRGRDRCRPRGCAEGGRRDPREVGRRQRQLGNHGRCGPRVNRGADRLRADYRVRQNQRGRAHHREPEPHTAGAETTQAERARGPEAVRPGECRGQPLNHEYTSG
jgi:hypothetical protein